MKTVIDQKLQNRLGGVPKTSQEKPVEDEKIESTPQALITKEDNITEHGSDNPPSTSTDRQTWNMKVKELLQEFCLLICLLDHLASANKRQRKI